MKKKKEKVRGKLDHVKACVDGPSLRRGIHPVACISEQAPQARETRRERRSRTPRRGGEEHERDGVRRAALFFFFSEHAQGSNPTRTPTYPTLTLPVARSPHTGAECRSCARRPRHGCPPRWDERCCSSGRTPHLVQRTTSRCAHCEGASEYQ